MKKPRKKNIYFDRMAIALGKYIEKDLGGVAVVVGGVSVGTRGPTKNHYFIEIDILGVPPKPRKKPLDNEI